MSEGSDIRLSNFKSTSEGLELQIELMGRTMRVSSRLIGRHNLYNILAAVAATSLMEIPNDSIREGIGSLMSVPGRFERVPLEAPFKVILDFAHTPNALEKALALAAEVSQKRVICVFGCGGDRDRGKRPLMGQIAAAKADFVIITSDNPRSEEPMSIIREIEQGIPSGARNFQSIVDRKEAIQRALAVAEPGDLVLLAGKGHEVYQEIDGKRIPFEERELVKEALCLR